MDLDENCTAKELAAACEELLDQVLRWRHPERYRPKLVPAERPEERLYGRALLRQVVEDLEARVGPKPSLTVVKGGGDA